MNTGGMRPFLGRWWPLILGIAVLFALGLLLAMASNQVPASDGLHAVEHLDVNECVEVTGLYDPSTNYSYLVARDKCKGGVAITKRF